MKLSSNLDESLEAIIQELTDVELERVSGGVATAGWGAMEPKDHNPDKSWMSHFAEQFKSFPNIFREPYDPPVTNPVIKA